MIIFCRRQFSQNRRFHFRLSPCHPAFLFSFFLLIAFIPSAFLKRCLADFRDAGRCPTELSYFVYAINLLLPLTGLKLIHWSACRFSPHFLFFFQTHIPIAHFLHSALRMAHVSAAYVATLHPRVLTSFFLVAFPNPPVKLDFK